MKIKLSEHFTDSCIESAITYSATVHYGHVDRNGTPYIFHPLRVCEYTRSGGYSLVHQITALLHDSVEDTPTTVDEIELYFGSEVSGAVEAITKIAGENYFDDYLPRVLEHPISKVVKLYDAYDNLTRGGSNIGEEYKYHRVITECIKAGVPYIVP